MLAFPFFALALLALTTPALGTSYKAVSPPDVLTVAYPTGKLSLGQNASMGCNDLDAPLSARGFVWSTHMSLRVPNGTVVQLGSVSNSLGCQQSGVDAAFPPSGVAFSFNIDTEDYNQTGIYTSMWNQTYGTLSDLTAANVSSCDPTKLSYQSWTFNTSFTVVSTQNLGVGTTKTDFTLSPAPTGKIWVSNAAGSVSLSLALLLGSIICVMLQLW